MSARLGIWWDISIFRINRGPQILQGCAVGEFLGSCLVDFCTVGFWWVSILWFLLRMIKSVEVGSSVGEHSAEVEFCSIKSSGLGYIWSVSILRFSFGRFMEGWGLDGLAFFASVSVDKFCKVGRLMG
jgi:hypothetical protein